MRLDRHLANSFAKSCFRVVGASADLHTPIVEPFNVIEHILRAMGQLQATGQLQAMGQSQRRSQSLFELWMAQASNPACIGRYILQRELQTV